MIGVTMGNMICAACLCLISNAAFAGTPINSPHTGIDDEPTTIWTANNTYGVSDILEYGQDIDTNISYRFVSSITNNVTVDVDSAGENWSVRDSVDSLSFRKTAAGYTLTRRKVGYTGVNTITFDANGNKLSETSSLSAPISASFSDAMQRLQQHYNANPQAASSRSAVGSGGFSCRGGMILGGLAIVGESIGYGLAWASGGIGGVAATPVYILAVHQTNRWVLQNCGMA